MLEISNVKVLSVNAGYFLGFDGSHTDYFMKPLRSVRADADVERNAINEFQELLDSVNPDAVLLQEVDSGSFRSSLENQIDLISDEASRFNWIYECKYRGLVFPNAPILRNMSNAVGIQGKNVVGHRLNHGRKNLVQEILLEDYSLFSVHLATFSKRVRRKQLSEIRELVEGKNSVISGDFNFHNPGEKESAENVLGMDIKSPGPTFPAKDPSQRLDLVAHSDSVEISGVKELGNRFSDHRPIRFSIDFM